MELQKTFKNKVYCFKKDYYGTYTLTIENYSTGEKIYNTFSENLRDILTNVNELVEDKDAILQRELIDYFYNSEWNFLMKFTKDMVKSYDKIIKHFNTF